MRWTEILMWVSDLRERNRVVSDFNKAAREAFISGYAPTLLQCSISKGERAYSHEFSRRVYSGFRIKALAGRALTRNEMMEIGMVVLNNMQLTRRLVVLGWDTLEVCDDHGLNGLRWSLIQYAKTGFFLKE